MEWVKLELDVVSFDPDRFADVVQRVADAGVALSTLTEEGDTPLDRRRLNELNAECSADIPGRGAFHTWEEYQRVRLGSPSFDPDGAVLALHSGRWVGMSALPHRDGYDYAFSDMTGTVRSHRGRGIATAMKVAGVDFARRIGVASIRTVHHPDNTAMIRLNRWLGYQDGHWDYPIG